MTTQELLALFNSLIEKNRWWSRFANSQFLKMMAVFAAQVIYYARMYAENALPEGFISTATKRSSILAAAEDRGYVARLIIPSEGTIDINNRSANQIQLPAYTTLWGDNQYPYVLTAGAVLPPGVKVTDIPVKQMELIKVTTDVDVGEEFYTIVLPKDITAKAVELSVYVTFAGKTERWTENPQFRLATNSSKNYVVFYKPTEQLGIRFGDGSIGAMIPDNCSVEIQVWTSEGDVTLVTGQRLQPSGAYQYLAPDLDIFTSKPITNGAAMESTEQTRNRAMYHVAYDDQVVWRGDYKYFLETRIAGINWMNIWGEHDEELATGVRNIANINKIFISGHKPGVADADLEDMINKVLNSIPNRMNKYFEYRTPKKLPYTIEVTGIAFTEIVPSDAMSLISKTLETKFGENAKNSDSMRTNNYAQLKVNEIWAAIQALNVLDRFEVKVNMPNQAKLMEDFVYLNIVGSTIKITH
ncbi:TPA: baseplate protein [Enterobacter cloacae]